MAWALFLVVAGIWAVFLLPPLWADRRPSSIPAARRRAGLEEPGPSAGTAQNTYQAPIRSTGANGEEHGQAAVLARRRRALLILCGGAVASLVALVFFGGPWFIGLHGAMVGLLIWYLATLRRIAKERYEWASLAPELEDEIPETSQARVVRSS